MTNVEELAVTIRQVAFNRNEMTVRLTLDSEVSKTGLSERLYTSEEVGDAQASEAELIAAPLRRRVSDLESAVREKDAGWKCSVGRVQELSGALLETQAKLDESRQLAEFKERSINDMYGEGDQLRAKIRELADANRQLAEKVIAEQKRADENKAWAERVELRLGEARALFQEKDAELIQCRRDCLGHYAEHRAKTREAEDALAAVIDDRDENHAWAKRAETTAAEALRRAERAENRLAERVNRMIRILDAVNAPDVRQALDQAANNQFQSDSLKTAVRQVRSIVGMPMDPDHPEGEPTTA